MRSLSELAREAIQIQDACNLSGLVHGWSRSVTELRKNLPDASTERINTHPINRLWVSKLFSLAAPVFVDGDGYGLAYRACKMMAEADASEIAEADQVGTEAEVYKAVKDGDPTEADLDYAYRVHGGSKTS